MRRERERLVEYLKETGVIRSRRVEEAFLAIPRENFVPDNLRSYAYADTPLPIGYGQTISAPHMVALMTELLEVEPGMRVLEIGTGSGYQAAILAYIVSQGDGHVYTVERVPQLAHRAARNILKTSHTLYQHVTIVVGDGSEGLPQFAPYDRIIVTAAAPDIPKPLVDQLKPGGIMVIPVGTRYEQTLTIVKKRDEKRIDVFRSIPCIFVPLIGRYGWRSDVEPYT